MLQEKKQPKNHPIGEKTIIQRNEAAQQPPLKLSSVKGNKLISISDAATLTGLSDKFLREQIAKRLLFTYKVKGQTLVVDEDVVRLKKSKAIPNVSAE